jgi:ABC-type transport system involved in multi-copper enzyme maturation permease subunit
MVRARHVLVLFLVYAILMAAYGVVDYGQFLQPEPSSNLFLPPNGNLLQVFYQVYDFGSLFALAFTFDAISRERQTNSITLLASQPISRTNLLAGKLLGRAALYLPLTSVPSISMVAASLALKGMLVADFQARILLVWILTLLFLLFWLTVGILISSVTSTTGSSLALCAVAWVVFQRYFLGSAFSDLALHLFWPNVSFSDAFDTPGFLNANNLFGSLFPPFHYVRALFGTTTGVGLPTTPTTYSVFGTNYVLNASTTAYKWFLFAWPDFVFLAVGASAVMTLSYVLFQKRELS